MRPTALLMLASSLLLASPGLAQDRGYAPVDPDPDPDPGSVTESQSGASEGYRGGSKDTRAEDLMPPSTRPMFFVGAVGPTFFGINRPGRRGPGAPGGPDGPDGPGFGALTRAKVAVELGFHLWDTFEGPALGFAIEQSFDDRFYVFNPSFKFWWDIQVVDEYAIYVTPWAKAGYALTAACEGCPDHAFNVGLGAEGRVVFEDRWVVLFRPIHIDSYVGNFFGDTFWLNYSLLIGGGVAF